MHGIELQHGDLKPENVLVFYEGRMVMCLLFPSALSLHSLSSLALSLTSFWDAVLLERFWIGQPSCSPRGTSVGDVFSSIPGITPTSRFHNVFRLESFGVLARDLLTGMWVHERVFR